MKRGCAAPVRVLAVTLAVALVARGQQPPAPASPPKVDACVACHADPRRCPAPELREPVAAFDEDVHKDMGLSCADCHGGRADADLDDPAAAALGHDVAAGFRGRPAPADIPGFCGRCHSDAVFMGRFDPDARVDQAQKYWTSVHGQRLEAGDLKVANCISCHGRHPGGEKAEALAHGIRAAADPLAPVYPTNVAQTCGRCHADPAYMAPYGIPTDQLALYGNSVHHEAMAERDDLSAPTCNDCHGNHGAHPPDVEDTSFVCGSCHVRQAELFRESTMKPAFDDLGLGECVVCHGNHRIDAPNDGMLFHEPLAAGAKPSGCWTCHADPTDQALASSTAIYGAIRGLDERIAQAAELIRDAGSKGMPVSDAEYRLAGANDALVEARTVLHRFRSGDVEVVAARGLAIADDALTMGQGALDDYYFRHRWLAVSLIGIGFVIAALLLKLRQVDRRWKPSQRARSAESG